MIMRNSVAPAYSRLAVHYDRFVGRCQFVQVQRMFERCVSKHGISFSSAADFGCGSGLFARYLARRWRVPVTAVDRSPHMLGVAVRSTCRLPVTFAMRDYRKLTLPRPVDLITMLSFTLNLEDSAATLDEILDSIWRNLVPGGYWIVDFLTPGQAAVPPPGSRDVQAKVISRQASRFCLRLRIRSRAASIWHEEHHCAHLLSPLDLRDQLERRRFSLVDALDHRSLGDAQQCSPAIVFVVRKPCSADVGL